MQDDLCVLSFGLGSEHGHVPTFWLLPCTDPLGFIGTARQTFSVPGCHTPFPRSGTQLQHHVLAADLTELPEVHH